MRPGRSNRSLASVPAGRSRALRWGVLTLVLCLGATLGVAYRSAGHEAQLRERELARSGEVIADKAAVAMARTNARLLAMSSLFRASDRVTQREFATFAGDVGLEPGTRAVAYVAAVPSEDLHGFLGRARGLAPGFRAFDLSEDLDPLPLGERDLHYLVLFIEPSEDFSHFVGADIATVRWLLGAVERTVATGENTATAPYDDTTGPIAVFQPVLRLNGDLQGIIAAVVDLGALVTYEVGPVVDGVEWALTDVGTEGAPREAGSQAPWHTTVDMAGRRWLVEAAPAPGMGAPRPFAWSLTLAAGVLASLATAGLVYTALRRIHARHENARLAAIGAQKDRFLATVSHELRTPLTAVIGFLEEMRQRWDTLDDDERSDLLSLVGDEAGEMAALVDDLLVGARLETGNPLPVGDGVVDMALEAQRVVDRMSRARGTVVEVTGSGWARADRMRVRQILRNVVDNALKHGRPPVMVEVSSDEIACTVTIRDEGDGVPACCRAQIFSAEASTEGHGHGPKANSNRLGLPVSAYLARLMGGELAYDGDRGAFTLMVPVASRAEVRAEVRHREILVG